MLHHLPHELMLVYIYFLSIFTISIYANNINNSVVKIFATISQPDQLIPWQSKKTIQVTGSGVLIKNRYILTSAHVVNDATYIEVKKQNGVKKYQSTIKYLSYDTDLALLEIKDKTFYKDMIPLDIGDLPKLQDEVRVVGYPKGGKDISITKGIISRIEYSRYALSSKEFLTIQIDAPINNGNSGGPALNSKNKIVGIAMQGLSKKSSEGIGYIVPPTVINHFLKDIEDGTLDGAIGSGFYYQKLLNSSLQEYYGFNNQVNNIAQNSGILITKVLVGSYLEDILKQDDIILNIDNHIIENDGTIKLDDDLVVDFRYLIHSKQIGKDINFIVLRDKKIKELKVKVKQANKLIKKEINRPKYFIYGGVVFRPVTSNYIKAKKYKVPTSWYEYFSLKSNQPLKDKDELVFIQNILPSSANSGYTKYNMLVESVNDIKIKSFKDLVSTIENIKDKFVVIKLDDNSKIVLNRTIVEKSNNLTLKHYNIPVDRNFNKEFEVVLLRGR